MVCLEIILLFQQLLASFNKTSFIPVYFYLQLYE